MNDADFTRVIVVFEDIDDAGMGDHHIMQTLDRAAEVKTGARREHALFFAFRKDFMIEIHTFLICSSGPTKNKIFR
jgi:hypothetical protein